MNDRYDRKNYIQGIIKHSTNSTRVQRLEEEYHTTSDLDKSESSLSTNTANMYSNFDTAPRIAERTVYNGVVNDNQLKNVHVYTTSAAYTQYPHIKEEYVKSTTLGGNNTLKSILKKSPSIGKKLYKSLRKITPNYRKNRGIESNLTKGNFSHISLHSNKQIHAECKSRCSFSPIHVNAYNSSIHDDAYAHSTEKGKCRENCSEHSTYQRALQDNELNTNKGLKGILKNELIHHLARSDLPNTLRKSRLDNMKNCKSDITHPNLRNQNTHMYNRTKECISFESVSPKYRHKLRRHRVGVNPQNHFRREERRCNEYGQFNALEYTQQRRGEENQTKNTSNATFNNKLQSQKQMRAGPTFSKQIIHDCVSTMHIESEENSSGVEESILSSETRNISSRKRNGELKTRNTNSGKSKNNANPAVYKKQYIKEEKQSSSCSYRSDVQNMEKDEIEYMSVTKTLSSSSILTSVERDELKAAHTRNVENQLHERKSTQILDSKSHRKSKSLVRSKPRKLSESENMKICARSRASRKQSGGQVGRRKSNMNVRSYNSLKELQRYLISKEKKRKHLKRTSSYVYSLPDRENKTEILRRGQRESKDRRKRVNKWIEKDVTSSYEKSHRKESSSDEKKSVKDTSLLVNKRGSVKVRKFSQSKLGQVKNGDKTAFRGRNSQLSGKTRKDRRARSSYVIGSDELACECRLNKNKVKFRVSSEENVTSSNDDECKQSSSTSRTCNPIHQCNNANMHNSFKSPTRIPTDSSPALKISRKNSRLVSYEKMNTIRRPEKYNKSKNKILLSDVISASKATRPKLLPIQNTPKLRQKSRSQPPVSTFIRSKRISSPRNIYSHSSQRIDTNSGASDHLTRSGRKHISNYRAKVSLRGTGKAPAYSSSDTKLITKRNAYFKIRSTGLHFHRNIDLRSSTLREQKSHRRTQNGGDNSSVDYLSAVNNSTASTRIASSNDSKEITEQRSCVKKSKNIQSRSGILKAQFSNGITPAVKKSKELTVISKTDLELSELPANTYFENRSSGMHSLKNIDIRSLTLRDQKSHASQNVKKSKEPTVISNTDLEFSELSANTYFENKSSGMYSHKNIDIRSSTLGDQKSHISQNVKKSNEPVVISKTDLELSELPANIHFENISSGMHSYKNIDKGSSTLRDQKSHISQNAKKSNEPVVISNTDLELSELPANMYFENRSSGMHSRKNIDIGSSNLRDQKSHVSQNAKKSNEPVVISNTDLELSERTENTYFENRSFGMHSRKNIDIRSSTLRDQKSRISQNGGDCRSLDLPSAINNSTVSTTIDSSNDSKEITMQSACIKKSRPNNIYSHGGILKAPFSNNITPAVKKSKEQTVLSKTDLELSACDSNGQSCQKRHGQVRKKCLVTFNEQASGERVQTSVTKIAIDVSKGGYPHAGTNVVTNRYQNATDSKQSSSESRYSNVTTCTKGTLVRNGDIDRTFWHSNCSYLDTNCVDTHVNKSFQTRVEDIPLNYINNRCINPQILTKGIMTRDVSVGSDHYLNDTSDNLCVVKTSSVRRDLNAPCSQSYSLLIDALESRIQTLALQQDMTNGDLTWQSEEDIKAFNESRDQLTQFLVLAAEKARVKAYPFASKYVQNVPDSNKQGKSGIAILQEALQRQLDMCNEIAKNHRMLMGQTSSHELAHSCSVFPQRFYSARLPDSEGNNDKEDNSKVVKEHVKEVLNVGSELFLKENVVDKKINQHSATLEKLPRSSRKCVHVKDLTKKMPVNNHSRDCISAEICAQCRINKETYNCVNSINDVLSSDFLPNLNRREINSHAKVDKFMDQVNDSNISKSLNKNTSYITAKSLSEPKENQSSSLKNQAQLSNNERTCFVCNVGLTENTKPESSVEDSKNGTSSATGRSKLSDSRPHNTSNSRSCHSLKSKSDSNLVISSRYTQKSYSRMKAHISKRSMQSSSIYAINQKLCVPMSSVLRKDEELIDSESVGMELRSTKKRDVPINAQNIGDKEITNCSNCRYLSGTVHTPVNPEHASTCRVLSGTVHTLGKSEHASTCRPLSGTVHTLGNPEHECTCGSGTTHILAKPKHTSVESSIEINREIRKNEIKFLHKKYCIPNNKDRLVDIPAIRMTPCNELNTNKKLILKHEELNQLSIPSVCFCNEISNDFNKLATAEMQRNDVIIIQNESGKFSVYESAKADVDSGAKNNLINNNNSNTPTAHSRKYILKSKNQKSNINEEGMKSRTLVPPQTLNNKALNSNSFKKVPEMISRRDLEIKMNKGNQGTLPQSSKRTTIIDDKLRNASNMCRHIESRTLPGQRRTPIETQTMQETDRNDRKCIVKTNTRKVSFFEQRPLIKKTLNKIQVRDSETTNHDRNIPRNHKQRNEGVFFKNVDGGSKLLRKKQLFQTWPSFSSHRITK